MDNYIVPRPLGKLVDQMPEVLAAGLIPASMEDIAQGRLEGILHFGGYYDTGDAVLNHPDGGVKIVRGYPALWDLVTPDARLRDGAIVLPDGFYEDQEGFSLTRAEIEAHYNRPMWKGNVLADPAWAALIPDEDLRRRYIEGAFDYALQVGAKTAMGLRFAKTPPTPEMHLWGANGGGKSYADGDSKRHKGAFFMRNRRLVRVTPEVHRGPSGLH